MTTIKIHYPSLENVAQHALSIANEMNEYADALPTKIINPLGSLTGGSSSNTLTVRSLANNKAYELRQRALRYQNLSSQLTSLVENAREADMRVKNKFMSIADRESEKFGWWQSIAYDFFQLVNGVTSSTPIGAFFNNLLSGITTVVEWGKKYIKDALEWFEHGNGRYVLNMALSVLGMAGAIAGAILAFPASGVFATIVGVAAAVSAVVSIFDTWATVTEGLKAWSLNDTQPGVARYYGSTTSLSDWANKESTDATVQALASGVNIVGNVAGIISFVGGGFTKTLDNGRKIGTLDLSTIKNNFTKTFGISFDETTKAPSFSFGTLFGFGQERTEAFTFAKGKEIYSTGALVTFYSAETVKIFATPAKNIASSLQVVTSSTAVDSFPNLKDLATLVGSIRPNFSGYGKVIGWFC